MHLLVDKLNYGITSEYMYFNFYYYRIMYNYSRVLYKIFGARKGKKV